MPSQVAVCSWRTLNRCPASTRANGKCHRYQPYDTVPSARSGRQLNTVVRSPDVQASTTRVTPV